VLSFCTAYGQNAAGKISGHIDDAETQKPVELVEIALLNKADNKVLSGAYSDEKGDFAIEHVTLGVYRLRIRFIGYKTAYIENVVLDAGHPKRNYPHISLEPDSVSLKTVTVTGEKSVFQNSIDKKVFNVDKSVVSDGGSANDVLQTVPSVSVDVDGNVSLRGNANVLVLIDGKPSGLTGGDRAAVLEQIPANSIDRIEIINNPSAKYDPDGTAGIINIILKKNVKPGVNGNVSAGIGDKGKYNGLADLNYRNRKINAFVNYAYRYNRRWGYEDIYRHNYVYNKDTVTSMHEHNDNARLFRTHFVRSGLDYYLNESNTIGINAVFNTYNVPEDQTLTYNYDALHGPVGGVTATHERRSSNDIDATLSYRHTFPQKDRELTASATYSDNRSNTLLASQQRSILEGGIVPDSLYNTTTTFHQKMVIAQADYVHPLNDKTEIQAGCKSIVRDMNTDYLAESYSYPKGQFINDYGISNNFVYNEQIHAVYGMFSSSAGKLSYQAGARLEQSIMNFKQLATGQEFNRDLFNVYPSAHLLYKVNDDRQFQLSYSRKINRPSSRVLNPFTDYSDPINPRFGNPYLQPEYINSCELSFMQRYDKYSFTTSLFARRTKNNVQFSRQLTDNILYTSYVNLGSSNSYGFEYIGRNDISKWWNLTSNLEVYTLSLLSGNTNIQSSSNNLCGFAKIVSNMTLLKNTILQITGNYQSTSPISQGYTWDIYGFDVGVRRDLWKNKLSASINLTDLFNTRLYRSYVYESGVFDQSGDRKKESRIITLNISYHFGKADVGKRKANNRSNDNDSDTGGEDTP
jgi:outer membrane receptor protein involved in Fe transport